MTDEEILKGIELLKYAIGDLKKELEANKANRDLARERWRKEGRNARQLAILRARSRGETFVAIGKAHGVGPQRARELYLTALRRWESGGLGGKAVAS